MRRLRPRERQDSYEATQCVSRRAVIRRVTLVVMLGLKAAFLKCAALLLEILWRLQGSLYLQMRDLELKEAE